MNILRISGISKQRHGQAVLQNISFTQKRFEKIAVAGETGSGKSTLLKIIAGLIQPDEGEVIFEDQRVLGPEEKLLPGHKGIGYLSQHFELRNNYLVEEELEYTNKLTEQQAQKIFEVCQVSHLLKRKTDQLSGGEKQRIVTARLLISTPKMLLLDEPFSNLDMGHKNMMKKVISDISETLQITCILVSHDPLDTLSWADQLLVLKDGLLLQKGTPEEIYQRPADAYTAALFGSYNLLTSLQVSALFRHLDLNTQGKNILLRPEQFIIVKESSDAVKGLIDDVHFFGGYYQLLVKVSNCRFMVKADATARFAKGDIVYISLSADQLWYV